MGLKDFQEKLVFTSKLPAGLYHLRDMRLSCDLNLRYFFQSRNDIINTYILKSSLAR